jgi:L-lactate dehydrogenase complex protein LldE
MRVALFITCLADVLYPRVGRATVSVLERLGHAVTFPPDQTCCGQMHTNTGYQDDASVLIRHHVDVFEQALQDGADAIVAPSGSCVGSVRHQHAQVAGELGER